ncbi:hypothetical protein B0F90DRAFT_1824836 [Multifurca ochricompacta]|uniref:Uncharacterized protein n=1 Tax=Multifurca ochricompacta TaxID=376703 RepID=A0AAD4LV34_9AGAM|nr:hypothetical protein B0F90DRAFT_1824836 [Multifurca ochricompacta]
MASGSNYASTGVSGIHEDNNTSQASQYVKHGHQNTQTTAQMGIMLTNVAVGTEDNLQDANPKCPQRRYLVTDLPFPHGSVEDPFGANNHVEGIIEDIWCLVYLDIPLGPSDVPARLGPKAAALAQPEAALAFLKSGLGQSCHRWLGPGPAWPKLQLLAEKIL